MSTMHYKGYEAVIEYDEDASLFHGEVINLRDVITFRNLILACGGEITEGQGSRVRIALNGIRAVFHRPHPQKETDKGAVKSI